MKAIYSFSILTLFTSLSIAAPAASPNTGMPVPNKKRYLVVFTDLYGTANKQSSDDYSNGPEPLNWIKREDSEQTEPLNWIKRRDDEQAEPLNWIKREEEQAEPLNWI